MKILVLNAADMEKVMNSRDAVEADRLALAAYAEGNVDIPLRPGTKVPEHNGNALYMLGYVPAAEALGVKIVSVYPDNIEKGLPSVPATMALLDAQTGIVNCIMDGTALTRIRTGAVSGLATELLSREDSRVFAMFGAGGQSRSQIDAVLTVRPQIELVKIYDMNVARAKELAAELQAKYEGKFRAKFVGADTPAQAVEDADIISTATVAKDPVFDGKMVKKGAHINAVGSYTPDMSEIDEYIVVNAGKVYIDTPDAVAESGDLIKPIAKGIFSEDKITGQLGDLINGKTPGRSDAEEITYFETVGNAVLDLVAAKKIYDLAIEKGIGQTIEM